MTIELSQSGQTYTNNGPTVSGSPPFLLSGDNVTLTNLSWIMPSDSGPAIVITGNGGTVINSGQINASFSSTAISGSAGADSITNSGFISGKVDLGAGNDSYINLSPGSSSQVLLGDGDDTYRLTANGNFASFMADGGSGQDTLQLQGSFDAIALANVTSFETLKIGNISPILYPDTVPEIDLALGFSNILIDPGTRIAFRFSSNPSAALSINGGSLSIYGASSFASVTGSSSADTVQISQTANILGSISLGGGDDAINLTDLISNQVFTIDGGDGNDTLTISNNANNVMDLSNVTHVESIVLSGSGSVGHVPDGANISASGNMTIDNSVIPNSSLYLSNSGTVTINANVQLGRYGAPDAYLNKATLAAVQTPGGQFTMVTNNGAIVNDVQLGMGSDFYAGTGTVGGTVYGYAGNDFLYGGAGDDRLDGGYGSDILGGMGGSDTLIGGDGNDTLDGGTGVDTMIGGAGNDNYVVDDAADVVTEAAGEGEDTVFTSVSWTLGAGQEVERITATGPAAINLAGNELLNILTGNDADNVLIGGGGFDTLIGGAGNDTLDGGTGQDSMIGGTGNDTYYVDNANDSVFESAGGGNDTVITSAYWGIAAGQSVETVTAAAGISGIGIIGNELDNILNGNDNESLLSGGGGNDTLNGAGGNDIVDGGDGDDIITGGTGIDMLTGGAGADVFKDMGARLSGDTITDFSAADRIVISDATLSGFTFSLVGHVLNYTGGSVTLSNISGARFTVTAAAGGGVQIALAPQTVRNDFNGDGRSDILWRNDNGQLSDWLGNANGGFTSNDANAFTSVPTSWHVADTGDFNGDGRSDILWRNDNGQMSDWLGIGGGGGFVSNDSRALATVGIDWHIAATGDFNGDGRSDILWRNNNGQLSDWLGTTLGGFVGNDANAFTTVATDWQVAGTGDFNGDGRSDILWRNADGQLSDWLGTANGGFLPNDANAFTSVPTAWRVAGTGDFNGDGISDILWRNDNGQLSDWLGTASGGFTPNDANAFTRVSTDWHITAVGDYNGDGRSDILWRNDNGQLSDWLGTASGGFAPNDANAFVSVPSAWRVQSHNLV